MTYLIIQPYCGDIMQYCSHLVLNNSNDTVIVLTIEGNKHRIINESKMFRLLGIKFRYFNDFNIESDVDIKDKQTLMDIECQIQEFLSRFFKEYKRTEIRIVIPFGNSSRLGKFVREVIKKNISIPYYYSDGDESKESGFTILREVNVSDIIDIKKSIKKLFYKDKNITKRNIEYIYIETEQELPF